VICSSRQDELQSSHCLRRCANRYQFAISRDDRLGFFHEPFCVLARGPITTPPNDQKPSQSSIYVNSEKACSDVNYATIYDDNKMIKLFPMLQLTLSAIGVTLLFLPDSNFSTNQFPMRAVNNQTTNEVFRYLLTAAIIFCLINDRQPWADLLSH
jgi:hypothetical protein